MHCMPWPEQLAYAGLHNLDASGDREQHTCFVMALLHMGCDLFCIKIVIAPQL